MERTLCWPSLESVVSFHLLHHHRCCLFMQSLDFCRGSTPFYPDCRLSQFTRNRKNDLAGNEAIEITFPVANARTQLDIRNTQPLHATIVAQGLN